MRQSEDTRWSPPYTGMTDADRQDDTVMETCQKQVHLCDMPKDVQLTSQND